MPAELGESSLRHTEDPDNAGGGEVATFGARPAAVGVDLNGLLPGDDDAGQDVLPVEAVDELVLFAGHGDSPSFLPMRVRLRRGGRAGVWVAGQGP